MRALRIATAAAAVAAVAAQQRQVGSQSFCDEHGRHHSVTYDTTYAVASTDIYDLDELPHLQEVHCDIDGSRLKLEFSSVIYASEYWMKFKLGQAFFTGGGKVGCPLPKDPTQKLLLRRVNGAGLSGSEVDVETSIAQYDEIYSDATIDYHSTANSEKCGLGAGADVRKCIGANVDESCKAAATTIPVYSKGPINLDCDSCFIGLTTDFFFNVQIKGFKLESLTGGFRNATALASVDLDAKTQKSWSVSIDKTKMILGGKANPVVTFKIGPVPFIFWFEVDMHLMADLTLNTQGEIKGGMQMAFDIGDDFISWDPTNKWKLHHSNISEKLTPKISGSAGFNGQANVHMIPTIGMHVNDIFSYQLTVDPNLELDFSSADKKICEDTKYSIAASHKANLHLNIAWDLIHTDKTWGPVTFYSKSGTLPQECTPPLADSEIVV